MAYLDKRQYEYREAKAAERNVRNAEIAIENGMTEEQAELIIRLCSLRHELHGSVDSLIKSAECSEWDIVKRLVRLNDEELPEAGLEEFINSDYIDNIDCIDMCFDIGEDSEGNLVPEDHDSEEFQEWYDATYYRASDAWEEVNTKIEHYLRGIDEKYNTHFKPTGALRIF